MLASVSPYGFPLPNSSVVPRQPPLRLLAHIPKNALRCTRRPRCQNHAGIDHFLQCCGRVVLCFRTNVDRIAIVCVPINKKGVLRVQLPNKKIWINHKRVKLHVAATELYPEDYGFSIFFDTVENRKKRHDMQRKYTDAVIEY